MPINHNVLLSTLVKSPGLVNVTILFMPLQVMATPTAENGFISLLHILHWFTSNKIPVRYTLYRIAGPDFNLTISVVAQSWSVRLEIEKSLV